MRSEAVVFACLLCAVSQAQQGAPRVYHVGGDVKAPILATRQEPEYSEEARVAKLQGAVVLHFVVGEDGRARDIRVVRSLGLGLDENAIAALAGWRFQPAEKAGQAVAVDSTVEVNFRLLKNPSEWSLSAVQFTAPPGASQPAILQAPYAPAAGPPEDASARVSFDVDLEGTPTNIQVEESSDPKWNDEVIALIREWRFQAALNNGTAVQSHAVLDLTRGLLPPPSGAPRKNQ
jgi:TonB family protein